MMEENMISKNLNKFIFEKINCFANVETDPMLPRLRYWYLLSSIKLLKSQL
jgi:hypothetical protein